MILAALPKTFHVSCHKLETFHCFSYLVVTLLACQQLQSHGLAFGLRWQTYASVYSWFMSLVFKREVALSDIDTNKNRFVIREKEKRRVKRH